MSENYWYTQEVKVGRFRITVEQTEKRRRFQIKMRDSAGEGWVECPLDTCDMAMILHAIRELENNVDNLMLNGVIESVSVPF